MEEMVNSPPIGGDGKSREETCTSLDSLVSSMAFLVIHSSHATTTI